MVSEVATRPIMWNVSAPINSVVMYGLFALASIVALVGVLRHCELWVSGTPALRRVLSLREKLFSLFRDAGLQRKVVRRKYAGLVIHLLIYTGFLALLFATTMVFLEHDLGLPIFRGNFYLGITVLSDVLGLGLIVGCLLAMFRRKAQKPDLLHTRKADSAALWFLIILCVQGFLLEAFRIAATDDPWRRYAPIGNALAYFCALLPSSVLVPVHFLTWWFHAVTFFVGWALLPYSKLFHIISSSANLYFTDNTRPKGHIASPGDLEVIMETESEPVLGLGTIKDYSWKQLLDLDACTSCGRCQDVCPAYRTGKPLSPKWLILDSRSHALGLQAKNYGESHVPAPLRKIDSWLNENVFFPSIGLKSSSDGMDANGEYRGANKLVQQAARQIAASADHMIAGEVMDENVFWSCTTCMACMEACPVGIEHVDHIIGNRQNMTMMRGEVPKEAQQMLRLLESQGSTFGSDISRVEWCKDLELKILKPGDEVDYLYWVGCISSFDPRKQRIARAVAQLMKQANLSFGILGEAEKCTGDPARRLGNEMLFQMFAKENIATLSQVKFKYLVANCPHCFNTLKNEYKEFGDWGSGTAAPKFIHHTQLIKELVANGSIKPKPDTAKKITFHDPCYLGRGNGEYDAPRAVVEAVQGSAPVEMELNKNKGLCCGAGGGHFWMDLKIGERINAVRTDQAAATGAQTIATGCPFCLHMMEDGVKLTNRDSSLEVKDVAELVIENL